MTTTNETHPTDATAHEESMTKPRIPKNCCYLRSTDGCDDCFDIVETGNERPLFSIHFWDDYGMGTARAEAKARLFAAAPEMLAALQRADAFFAAAGETDAGAGETAQAVREAIAKATVTMTNEMRRVMDCRRPDESISHAARQLEEILPHIRRASAALLECWDELRSAERILSIEITTEELGVLAGEPCVPQEASLTPDAVAKWLKWLFEVKEGCPSNGDTAKR